MSVLLTDINYVATVQDLIDFLLKNFNGDEKLCFFYEGGAWCEVEHVLKSLLGDLRWMFNYVKDKRQHELLDTLYCCKDSKEEMIRIINDNYKNVNDDAVVIY